jgi:hypothetical protein
MRKTGWYVTEASRRPRSTVGGLAPIRQLIGGECMTIQPVSSLKEFFRDALHDALAHQHVAVEGETEHYVVNLLTLFSDADALFERDAEGQSRSRLKPLAIMLGEALDAPTHEARFRALQRLGDVSLFIAGFFSAGFARKLVDIDYHIAMGGRAYGTLAENCSPARGRTMRQVFGELAAKFTPMVDALNEISETSSRPWWTRSTKSARPRTSTRIAIACGCTSCG